MTGLTQRDIGGEVDSLAEKVDTLSSDAFHNAERIRECKMDIDFLKDDVKRLDKSFMILTVVVFVHLIVTSVLVLCILNMQ